MTPNAAIALEADFINLFNHYASRHGKTWTTLTLAKLVEERMNELLRDETEKEQEKP